MNQKARPKLENKSNCPAIKRRESEFYYRANMQRQHPHQSILHIGGLVQFPQKTEAKFVEKMEKGIKRQSKCVTKLPAGQGRCSSSPIFPVRQDVDWIGSVPLRWSCLDLSRSNLDKDPGLCVKELCWLNFVRKRGMCLANDIKLSKDLTDELWSLVAEMGSPCG